MSSPNKIRIKNPYRPAQWMSRLHPHDIGEPTHISLKKKPRISPDMKQPPPKKDIKVEPSTKPDNGSFDNAIDLTDNEIIVLPLPVTPLNILKMQNPVFFTYNPYGYPKRCTLPVGCCYSCRCPEAYCAERVFGEMCLKQAEYEVYTVQGMSKIHPRNVDELRILFETIYTAAVKHKMMWNNIALPAAFRGKHIVGVPRCVKNNSLRRFVLNYRYECKTDEESPVSSPTIYIDGEGYDTNSTSTSCDGNHHAKYRKHFSM